MADKEKATLARLVKLVDVLRDLQFKLDAITDEIALLLRGEKTSGDHLKELEGAFDLAWCAEYAPGQQGRYVWVKARDRGNWKRLLQSLDAAELKDRICVYLQNKDPFFVRGRHSFGLFVASINQHAKPQPIQTRAHSALMDCFHEPPCRSDEEHTARRSAELRRSAESPVRS